MTDHELNLENLKEICHRVYGDDFVWDDGTTRCAKWACEEWLWDRDDVLLTHDELNLFHTCLLFLRDGIPSLA